MFLLVFKFFFGGFWDLYEAVGVLV